MIDWLGKNVNKVMPGRLVEVAAVEPKREEPAAAPAAQN